MSDLSPRRSFSFNDVDLVYSYSEGESPVRLPTIQGSPNQPAVEQVSPETPQERRAFLSDRKTKGDGPQAPTLDDLMPDVTIDFSLTDEESDLEDDQPNPSLLPRQRLPVSPPSSSGSRRHQRRRSASLMDTSLEKSLPMRRSTSTPTVRPASSAPLIETEIRKGETSTLLNENVTSPDRTTETKKVTLDLLDQGMATTDEQIKMRRVSSLPSTPRPTTAHPMDERRDPTKQAFRSPVKHHSPYKFQRQMSLPVVQGRRHDIPLHGSTVELRQFAQNFQLASPTRPTRSSIFRASSYLGPETESSPSVNKEQRLPTERSFTDGSDASGNRGVSSSPIKRRRGPSINEEEDGEQQTDASSHKSDGPLFVRQEGQYMLYLSTFAIFGETFRVYIERFFGADCEAPNAVNDVFSPFFRQICVTASGWTDQTGGALFLSLPANMIGCFIMGLLSNLEPELWPPIPWFRADHPLQRHDALHVALRTGLCGSLTTFASWNTQMIVMLDGTNTDLGSQIVPALCGYVIGLFTAIASFLFGIQVSTWMNRWKNPAIKQQQDSEYYSETFATMEEGVSDRMESGTVPTGWIIVLPSFGLRNHTWVLKAKRFFGSAKLPFVILAVLMSVYAVADAVMGIQFYRMMWLSALLTPPGAILRWKLTKWAGRTTMSSPGWKRFEWIEWGTFTANFLGSIISVLVTALHSRYYSGPKDDTWAVALLMAAKIGFAGSLSTVSTMAKEVHDLARENPNHAKCYYYPLFTIVCCAVVSLIIYMPIVRSGR